uniref:(northern house mosquito) hypothetical protein n=1 Tax=Culex pipiens TaxID=7175 RepID=A0A8D7ZSX0_CULPI
MSAVPRLPPRRTPPATKVTSAVAPPCSLRPNVVCPVLLLSRNRLIRSAEVLPDAFDPSVASPTRSSRLRFPGLDTDGPAPEPSGNSSPCSPPPSAARFRRLYRLMRSALSTGAAVGSSANCLSSSLSSLFRFR